MASERKNAVIESTMLGVEDHGILSCWLNLKYDGSGQGFGGYSLDGPKKDAAGKFLGRFGTAYGAEFIRLILATLKVERWEKLPGTPLRVEADHSHVYAIGHYIDDRWFRPETDLKKFIDGE